MYSHKKRAVRLSNGGLAQAVVVDVTGLSAVEQIQTRTKTCC